MKYCTECNVHYHAVDGDCPICERPTTDSTEATA